MRKFLLLLNKEIKELLTLQMIVPFIAIMLVFSLIGNIMKSEIKKETTKKQNLVVMDYDKTNLSKSIISALKISGFEVNEENTINETDFQNKIKKDKIPASFVIPRDFEKSILEKKYIDISTYVQINNFSLTATKSLTAIDSAYRIINQTISDGIITSGGLIDPNYVKNPIKKNPHVIVSGKMAEVDPSLVINFVSQQTVFIPIILFMVIVLASQMIAVAIASEKENKTLETLLSTPIDRKIVVSAKMMAAGIVSLIMAAIYLYGMKNYMSGFTGDVATGSSGIDQAARDLGLTFTTGNYLLLGATLFLGILTAIAISIILGVFAEDAKSAQGVVTPLMVLVMIPYFLTLFTDINSLPVIYKYLAYAIPFTHTFLAAPNILIGNYSLVVYGIIYQAIVFIIFVFVAAKIFSTDKIFTLKLNFGKKKSMNA